MATTVIGGFYDLLKDLDLTERQEQIADARVDHLETWFINNISCARYPFKIGSYERGTVIRWRRDIDMLVALAYDPYWERYGSDSSALLYWLRGKLDAAYGSTTVSTRQVAIRMALSDGLQVDLVPGFVRKNEGFLIPDGKGRWQSTNPPFHSDLIAKNDRRLGYKLTPLLRLMKAWNESNGRHLRSFHLEMMVDEMWHKEATVGDHPHAVADALRKGITWLTYPMHDPWLDAGLVALDGYLTADERARVIRMFEADRKRADDAITLLAAGKTKDAYDKWNDVFPGRFPGYG
jgi:hypothetical protein